MAVFRQSRVLRFLYECQDVTTISSAPKTLPFPNGVPRLGIDARSLWPVEEVLFLDVLPFEEGKAEIHIVLVSPQITPSITVVGAPNP